MCMMVYLGVAKPLRLVPWDETQPAFHVAELSPEEDAAALSAQLRSPSVYYAGAFEGCGCGFQLGEFPEYRDEDEQQGLKRAALTAFADYLRSELARVSEIRVFACWAGDESKEPQHKRELTPTSLVRDDFYFLEGEISVVRGDAGQ